MNAVDLNAWINDLGSEDEKVAASGRRRLVARGTLVVEPLRLVLLQPKNVAQYRGALRVLADVAAAGNLPDVAGLRGLLLEHLRGQDGAARRSVITCLSHLGPDAAAEIALLELWTAEKRDDQLRVLAAALGRVGGKASASALESCGSTAPLVLREVTKSRASIRSRQFRAEVGEGRVAAEKVVPGIGVRLRCRAGLGGLLLQTLPATVRDARETAPGQVDGILHGSLNSLLDCRLWSEVVLRIDLPRGLATPVALAAALRGAAGDLLRVLTHGPPTWRLEMPHTSRGELLDTVAAAQRAAPDLGNSPVRAVWELRPLAGELELLPRFWRDTRFAYLRANMPAMTHAPLAAALAVLSEPQAGDVVWDPFCGTGTELAERARAGAYARLIGSDRDEEALNAARHNLQGIERLSLERGDAFALHPKGVNVLLTNPPYGRKVKSGNIALLLRKLLEQASRQMPRGRIVLCSPLPVETWRWARELGWKTARRLAAGTEGHDVEAQLFTRD